MGGDIDDGVVRFNVPFRFLRLGILQLNQLGGRLSSWFAIGIYLPEVFSRNFGGVSHKSDVYSYGMLILEMVGVNKNFDVEV